MTEDARPAADPLVSGAEIARLAGVTRAAVSNWRRRYPDFPRPAGGAAGAPLFSLGEVRAWLAAHRKGKDVPDEARLWQALKGTAPGGLPGALAAVAAFLATGEPSGLDPGVASLAASLAERRSPAAVVTALTDRYLDAARRTGSDRVTSARVVRAVAHFARPVPKDATLFDPACGIGTLLAAVGPAAGPRRLGQEADPGAARFAMLRSALTGPSRLTVRHGDSLRADAWPSLRADLVICDPPAAEADWGREELLLDTRWELGTPSRAEGELAWLQHCFFHTAPGGRAIVVMTASAAYRKAGRRIRAELVRRGILTSVIALPPGVAASHALPVHLWTLRRPASPAEAADRVRMVDLTGNDPDGPLNPAPQQVTEVPALALLDDTVDLTPAAHVRASRRDVPAEYRELRRQLDERLRALRDLLPPLVTGPGTGSLAGASVPLADLARAGLVDLASGTPVSASDQLDTDYLAGFVRRDARGARVPQMAVADQRRYGAAFRALRAFEENLDALTELGRRAACLAYQGLTEGALAPGDPVP